jgi:hypothetical protein
MGAGPGELIGAHANTFKALAPHMVRMVNASKNDEEKQQQLARIDNIYASLAQASPKIAKEFSDNVLTQKTSYMGSDKNSDGSDMTVRNAIELAKETDGFKNTKSSFTFPGMGGPTTPPKA